ncbi:MAG TPA: NAD-glutamate dehydrogenase, partial [Candidatus Berkiella sp.]|nr:NAD-glutamate dehydrogenase [Candidatus Berkiella sp.]
MTRQLEEAREELIGRVIALVKDKLPASEAQLIESFVKQYYLSAAPEDLLERNILDLYGALVSFWHFVNHRHPHEVKVRVYNPQFEQHGWQSTHTVIEIVNDNLPFLIESVGMVLNRLGFNVHLILHTNGLKIERDAKGQINKIYMGKSNNGNGPTEMPIFIEVDRQSDPAVLEKLQKCIEGTINEVSLAVCDWHP